MKKKPAPRRRQKRERKKKISLTLFHEWSFLSHMHGESLLAFFFLLKLSSCFFYASLMIFLLLPTFALLHFDSITQSWLLLRHFLCSPNSKHGVWLLASLEKVLKLSLLEREREKKKCGALETIEKKCETVEKLSRLIVGMMSNHLGCRKNKTWRSYQIA